MVSTGKGRCRLGLQGRGDARGPHLLPGPLTRGEQRRRTKGQEGASHYWWGMTPAFTLQDPSARWAPECGEWSPGPPCGPRPRPHRGGCSCIGSWACSPAAGPLSGDTGAGIPAAAASGGCGALAGGPNPSPEPSTPTHTPRPTPLCWPLPQPQRMGVGAGGGAEQAAVRHLELLPEALLGLLAGIHGLVELPHTALNACGADSRGLEGLAGRGPHPSLAGSSGPHSAPAPTPLPSATWRQPGVLFPGWGCARIPCPPRWRSPLRAQGSGAQGHTCWRCTTVPDLSTRGFFL